MSQVIGQFAREGELFTGTIKTAFWEINARFVRPEGGPASDKAPKFRVMTDQYEFGAAWERKSKEGGGIYWSVKLDDPAFSAPLNAKLVVLKNDPNKLLLIWER